MTKEIRQGLGLACLAVVLLLIGATGEGDAAALFRVAGFLFLIGGAIVVAVGLFRAPPQR